MLKNETTCMLAKNWVALVYDNHLGLLILLRNAYNVIKSKNEKKKTKAVNGNETIIECGFSLAHQLTNSALYISLSEGEELVVE